MLRMSLAALFASVALLGCPQNTAPAQTATKAEAPEGQQAQQVAAPASQPAPKGKGESPDDRNQKDADGVVRRGEKLSDGKALAVSEAIAKADALDGKSVKIEGTVSSVCAKKGCWFVVRDDMSDQTIRITSKDYRFFVPTDARGQRAVIEGELAVKTLSEADAKHLAEDGNQDPSQVQGEQKEVQIAAVGLEMRTPAHK